MAAKVLGVDHAGSFAASLTGSPGADAGCAAVGEPLAIPDGARKGSLFAYVHDPDGVTLELTQLVPSQPEHPGGTS